MLEGWLEYLEIGRSFYKDFVSCFDDNELIDKIKTFY